MWACLVLPELQPRVRGWLLASADGKKEGLVPANYVKVMGKRNGRAKVQPGSEPTNTTSQPVLPNVAAPQQGGAVSRLPTVQSHETLWNTHDSGPSFEASPSELNSQWGPGASSSNQMNSSQFSNVFDTHTAELSPSDTNVMNRTASDILDSTKDTAD